jgi:hypothetical protein
MPRSTPTVPLEHPGARPGEAGIVDATCMRADPR